jgi:hypothetical protein
MTVYRRAGVYRGLAAILPSPIFRLVSIRAARMIRSSATRAASIVVRIEKSGRHVSSNA